MGFKVSVLNRRRSDVPPSLPAPPFRWALVGGRAAASPDASLRPSVKSKATSSGSRTPAPGGNATLDLGPWLGLLGGAAVLVGCGGGHASEVGAPTPEVGTKGAQVTDPFCEGRPRLFYCQDFDRPLSSEASALFSKSEGDAIATVDDPTAPSGPRVLRLRSQAPSPGSWLRSPLLPKPERVNALLMVRVTSVGQGATFARLEGAQGHHLVLGVGGDGRLQLQEHSPRQEEPPVTHPSSIPYDAQDWMSMRWDVRSKEGIDRVRLRLGDETVFEAEPLRYRLLGEGMTLAVGLRAEGPSPSELALDNITFAAGAE